MEEKKFILSLDQGTTSSRALVVDHDCNIIASSQKEFTQIFPKAGWVEHDPIEIWASQSSVATEAIARAGITGADIAAIGITNQRETTIVWDRETSEPVYNAIVWQDRRTAEFCEGLKAAGKADMIREKTGLVIDAYFSGTKIAWILDNVEGARERAERGELCFGTVDSWLVWKFTKGAAHVTDVSNAARTMLFNIHTMQWDDELLELLDIPKAMLPEVKSNSEVYCQTATTLFATKIPIAGMAGDQQAALFGQLCHTPGSAKSTYGTGCFVLMNTGDKPLKSENNLLTTVGWKIGDKVTYALEGSVFIGGAVVQWLRDQLKIVESARDTEAIATSVEDNAGVYFVPALAGLGAPHWDQYARGTIVGITRGTTRAHIVRAALESIAFQVHDLVTAMEADVKCKSLELKVDGGASQNNFLMQFQADVNRQSVIRPANVESTAMGAAFLAGLAVGYWNDVEEIAKLKEIDKHFTPQDNAELTTKMLKRWHKAVQRSLAWDVDED